MSSDMTSPDMIAFRRCLCGREKDPAESYCPRCRDGVQRAGDRAAGVDADDDDRTDFRWM